MGKLKQWQEKIDNLSLRERLAVFSCVLLLTFFGWDMFLMQPVQDREKGLKSQVQKKQTEQLILNTQIQNIVADLRKDPGKIQKEKINLLKAQLGKLELDVQASTQRLISPKKMAIMLETVLRKVKGLQLLEVKGLGAEPVIKISDAGEDETKDGSVTPEKKVRTIVDNAYKHGLSIAFEGDYLSMLEYIQELENLEWGFFWDSLEFEVVEYPESRATITIFSLSLDKNWIGV